MSDQGADAGKDATEDTGSGGTTDETTVHAQIATSGLMVETAKEVLKSSAAAAAAAPPAATTPPAAACCDAYPSEALKEALAMPIDSKTLAEKDVPEEVRSQLLALNQPIIDARVDLLKKSAWATAPELMLLDACTKEQRPVLARRVLEIRTGMTKEDDDRRKAEVALARERVEVAKVARETLDVGKKQMAKWTGLADKGKEMLVATTCFSAVVIAFVVYFASEGKLDGTETPIIIFILAIFAISPAVLLLLERPLEGLDKFTPGGTAGGDSDSAAAGGSGEGTAK